MRWLGSSQGHLMLLQHGAAPALTQLDVAEVGCNCMSVAELPPAAPTATTTLLLTDMSDPRGDDVDDEGSVRLYLASAVQSAGVSGSGGGGGGGGYEGTVAPAPASPLGSVVATTGGRSPCAVAINPQAWPGRAAQTFLAAVACYEGPAGAADGVVALFELTAQAAGGAWRLGSSSGGSSSSAATVTGAIGKPAAVAPHGAGSPVGGGATPGEGRQDAAHPHGVEWWPAPSADGAGQAAAAAAVAAATVLFVADLGANKVVAYEVAATVEQATVEQQDGAGGTEEGAGGGAPSLKCVAVCALHAGAGPRHMRLVERSATAATLFVVNELDNTLAAIDVQRGGGGGDGGSGSVQMHCTQTVSTLPADFDPARAPPFDFYTAASHACALVLHTPAAPAAPLLLVSNRGDDSVATFRVVASDGGGGGGGGGEAAAELLGHASCAPGRLPWDLSVDRTGKLAAVTTQFDAELSAAGGSLALWDVEDCAPLAARAQPTAVTVANVLAVRFLEGGVA